MEYQKILEMPQKVKSKTDANMMYLHRGKENTL